jgi:hypothetical protein
MNEDDRRRSPRRLVERCARVASLNVDADTTVAVGLVGRNHGGEESANLHREDEDATFGFLTLRL